MSKKPTDMNTLVNQPTKAALAFRDFRKKIEAEGWFNRKWYMDAIYNGAVVLMSRGFCLFLPPCGLDLTLS
jgi:hypothetical protein